MECQLLRQPRRLAYRRFNHWRHVLPVALTTGNIYTLSIDIALTEAASSAKYMFLGFVDQGTVRNAGLSDAAGRHNNATMRGYPTIGVVTNGGLIQGTELYNSVVASTTNATIGSTHTYKIVLNTTGDGSSFKASYYLDGVAFGTDLVMDYAALSSIGGVGFSSRTTTGTVDNFLFTVEAIPEPRAALLGSLGMLALLRRRRN